MPFYLSPLQYLLDRHSDQLSNVFFYSIIPPAKNSVRVVETMFTATPEFFKGKKLPEIRRYFEEALRFFEQYQSRETIISAVVHMDERKTPHMHLSFVPLTADGRLSAKEIVGQQKRS